MFDKILERIVVDRRYVPRSDSELVVHTFLGVCGDVFDIENEDVLLVVAEMLKCNHSLRGSLTLIYFEAPVIITHAEITDGAPMPGLIAV